MAGHLELSVSVPVRKTGRLRRAALTFLGVCGAGVFLCLLVLFILWKTGILTAVSQDMIAKSKIAAARADENTLVQAITAYQTDYNADLSGDNPHIMAALRGDNPRKVIYYETAPRRLAANGACLDPWGTPYQIALADFGNTTPSASPGMPRVRSAGPNQVFDESQPSDDIVSGP